MHIKRSIAPNPSLVILSIFKVAKKSYGYSRETLCGLIHERQNKRTTAIRNLRIKKRTKNASTAGKIDVVEKRTFPKAPKDMPELIIYFFDNFLKLPVIAGKRRMVASGKYEKTIGTALYKFNVKFL